MGRPPLPWSMKILSAPVTLSPEAPLAGQGKQQLLGAEWQRCWACESSSCRNIIFTAIIIFSVSLDTWYFVFSLYISVSRNVLWLSCCGSLTGETPSPAGASSPWRSTYSVFDGLSLGFPARIWCWETNLNLGYRPEFVFYWSDRELWKRLPVSRAAWQLLHWAGMLADLDFLFFFPLFFIFVFPFRPNRWASILLGPAGAAWLRVAGIFLLRSTLQFPKVRHSIHPPSCDILNGFQSYSAATGWNDGTALSASPQSWLWHHLAELFCVSNII